jgi:hypothetical protein
MANGYDAMALYEIVLEADTDGDGQYERIGSVPIRSTYDDETVSVPESRPEDFVTMRAAPNPFTNGSTLHFALASREHVSLAVFDASGRLVRRLVRGELAAGPHAFEWDGRDAGGRDAAIGIYFVKLFAGPNRLETKVVKLR